MRPPNLLSSIDWKLIFPVVVLVIISLTTLFSINIGFFKNQLFFVFISIIIFLILSQINYKIIQYYAPIIYWGSIGILILVLLIGLESRGAVRWLEFFGLQIQFSEILKPFLALVFSSFLATKEKTFRTFAMTLGLAFPIIFLIFKQPDLGNALLYLGTILLTFIFLDFPLLWFLGGFIGICASFPLIWNFFLHDYQKSRITSFLHAGGDPLGISYNAIQSVIAVGSGFWLGKGFGQGTQSMLKFLPERQTDFIFATITEQLGFVGACIIIAAFMFFLFRIYQIFNQTDDLFVKIFLTCAFCFFSIQIFVNIGMTIGIVPIVGVTLPFVSYGGSSLLSSVIFLSFISTMGAKSKSRNVLEIT